MFRFLFIYSFLLILIKAMNKSEKKNFLIDGFPRNKDNIDQWKKTMNNKVEIQRVIVFDCDQKVLKKRFSLAIKFCFKD